MAFRNRSIAVTLGALCVAMLPGHAFGQIAELKRMTLEELSQQEVVSVSRAPEPYGEAPSAIQVITQEDIRRSGATSLAEALRLADNLVVAQKTSHDWAISARGFNTDLANKLLVLIDGRTVYTPLFSGVFWDRQDYLLEDIERIEVISGPGGTLWGANAVNGVINIVTKAAGGSQGFYAEGAGGSQVHGLGGVRYGGAIAPGVFYRVYAKHAGRDDERLPDGREASDSWRMTRGGFRIDAERSRDAFTLQGDVYRGHENLATGGAGRVGGGHVLGRWSRKLSEESDLSLQVYYDRAHLALPVPPLVAGGITLAPEGTLGDDLDTFDIDFQHRLPPRRGHGVTWGLGYRFTHDVARNSPALGFVPPELDQQRFSGFVQDDITLARRLTLTIGTKIEHNDYTGVEAEPSGRLRWTIGPTQLLWAAVSRAVRMPSRVDRDQRLGTPALSPIVDNLLIGGVNFESETVIAYEAGYRARLGETVSGSVSVFYNTYDDLRSTSLSAPDPVLGLPFPLFFENNLEGETYGVELSARHEVRDWWRMHAGYTFLGEDIRVKPGKTDFNNALNETADPRHQFAVRSSMDLPNRVELDVAFRWVGSLRYNDAGVAATVPSYGELGARLGWFPVPHLELSFVGQNLLHDQHLEYVISSPNPREEVGRSLYGRAAVRW